MEIKSIIKSKKAFLPALIMPLIIGLVIVIALIAFLASAKMRWILIGIAGLVGTFLVILPAIINKGIDRKGIALIVICFSVFGGLIVVGQFSQSYLGNVFVNPDWARLECAPTDGYEYNLIKWLDEQTLFKCDGFTEECRVQITDSPSSSCIGLLRPNGKYHLCDINGDNCNSGTIYDLCGGQQSDWIVINSLQSLKFDTGLLVSGEERTKINLQYRPWKLYRFVGGSKYEVNNANCDITSSTQANIRSEDYPGSKLYRQGGEGTKWINYVNAWNYGPGTNVFEYLGRPVYCNAAQIYEIISLQMSDGKLVKLDPSVTDTLPNGDTISGMGNKIKNVECCPNEPNCGTDFRFKQTEPTCFTDAQCLNTGGPIPQTSTTYIKYVCENSKCTQKGPFTVDCTTNGVCTPPQICDLSTTNYGHCITPLPEGCGDNECSPLAGETAATCPTDCKDTSCSDKAKRYPWLGYELDPGKNQPWYLNLIGIKDQAPVCKATFLPYYIGAVVIIVLGSTIYLLLKPQNKRRKK